MQQKLDQLDRVVNAEDFFELFELDYDPQVVRVNRLHILKKFSLFKEGIDSTATLLAPADRYVLYREALERAYQTFLSRTALDERLFKVFKAPGGGVVPLAALSGNQ